MDPYQILGVSPVDSNQPHLHVLLSLIMTMKLIDLKLRGILL